MTDSAMLDSDLSWCMLILISNMVLNFIFNKQLPMVFLMDKAPGDSFGSANFALEKRR